MGQQPVDEIGRHLGRDVRAADDQGDLTASPGQVQRRLACGVRAADHRYRALPLERWPDFEGAGIYYAATELEARGYTGSPVTVVGGANSAGQAALYLAGRGSEVSLVVRGPDIATEMSAYLVDRLLAHP
ncbi:MAG TPA: NAD(P)-binding domain-containing protein, partial [Streptosporangiaceae bacterium]|nr:NAD(P)-binding domain-containing protein [Streptosporangiaceae bacterium]